MKFPKEVFVLFLVIFLSFYVQSTNSYSDEEPANDNDIVDSENVVLNFKKIIDAPIYCPSNYRLDNRGKCRRIE